MDTEKLKFWLLFITNSTFLKAIVETSSLKLSQIAYIFINLKYMEFFKRVNLMNSKELSITAKKCESILKILND